MCTQPVIRSSLCTHTKHHRPVLITPRASRCITLLWKHSLSEWSLRLSEPDQATKMSGFHMDGQRKGGVWEEEWNHLMMTHLVTVMIQAFFQSWDPCYVFVLNVRPKGLNYSTVMHPAILSPAAKTVDTIWHFPSPGKQQSSSLFLLLETGDGTLWAAY